MKKEKYNEPELNITLFEMGKDIIVASNEMPIAPYGATSEEGE